MLLSALGATTGGFQSRHGKWAGWSGGARASWLVCLSCSVGLAWGGGLPGSGSTSNNSHNMPPAPMPSATSSFLLPVRGRHVVLGHTLPEPAGSPFIHPRNSRRDGAPPSHGSHVRGWGWAPRGAGSPKRVLGGTRDQSHHWAFVSPGLMRRQGPQSHPAPQERSPAAGGTAAVPRGQAGPPSAPSRACFLPEASWCWLRGLPNRLW